MATVEAQTPDIAAQAPPAPDSLAWLLAHTSHVLTTELTAAMGDLGLSPRAHCVLTVADSGEYTQKEIAATIGLDKTTMVVTLDELEHQGLAERRPSPTDRRARVVAVTKTGRDMVAKGQDIISTVQDEILGSLPAREREALMSALQRLSCDRLSTPAACQGAPRRRRAS